MVSGAAADRPPQLKASGRNLLGAKGVTQAVYGLAARAPPPSWTTVADGTITYISALDFPAAGNFLWSGALASPRRSAQTIRSVCCPMGSPPGYFFRPLAHLWHKIPAAAPGKAAGLRRCGRLLPIVNVFLITRPGCACRRAPTAGSCVRFANWNSVQNLPSAAPMTYRSPKPPTTTATVQPAMASRVEIGLLPMTV